MEPTWLRLNMFTSTFQKEINDGPTSLITPSIYFNLISIDWLCGTRSIYIFFHFIPFVISQPPSNFFILLFTFQFYKRKNLQQYFLSLLLIKLKQQIFWRWCQCHLQWSHWFYYSIGGVRVWKIIFSVYPQGEYIINFSKPIISSLARFFAFVLTITYTFLNLILALALAHSWTIVRMWLFRKSFIIIIIIL